MSFRLSWQRGRSANEGVVREVVEPWIPSDMVWQASLLPTISGQARPSQDSTSNPGCLQSGQCTASQITGPTALINTLPPEILGKIFFHYVHDRCSQSFSFLPETWRFGHVSAYKGATTNPIVLGHICSHWRVISLAMPTLWSTIYTDKPRLRDVPLFALWLERSGEVPLDLTIIQSFPESAGVDLAIRKVLWDVISQCQRWRTVYFKIYQDVEDLFRHLRAAPLVGLESAHLNLLGWSYKNTVRFYRTLYKSPSLRRIRWGSGFYECDNVPWCQLQRVEFHRLPSAILLHILSKCSLIEYLSVDILDYVETAVDMPNVRLPYLHTLDLQVLDDFSEVIDHLELPSLTGLRLPSGFGLISSPDVGWSSLSALLQRSHCSLQEFVIYDGSPDDDNLAQRLESFSKSLRHLTIRSTVTDETILYLTHALENKPLPLLEFIDLQDCWSTDGTLSAMILSRTQGPIFESRLKQVKARLRGSNFVQDLALEVPDVLIQLDRL